MLIECKGIRKGKYFIPPFVLNEREIVILHLFGGTHFYDLSIFLAGVFSGQTINENVTVNQPLKFVEHFVEPSFRRLFFPITIGEYIKRKSGNERAIAEKVFTLGYLNNKTHVNTLNGDRRKILSLYTTLSVSKNIVLDLVGLDPSGAKKTYSIVKENVKNGGSAILLENFEDFKDDCTKFVQIEIVDQ